MASFVSCDPGVHTCYFAHWFDGALRATYDYIPYTSYSLVIEIPQVYRGRLQKGDPNDLIDLAFSAGKVAANFTQVITVRPREWKRQVPKKIMMRRILEKLSPAELEVLGDRAKNHNFVDAVGIGLWHLGRI